MKKLFKLGVILIAAATFSTSCNKESFDINQNPNSPEKVDITFVFPNAVQYTGYIMGNYFQIWGGLWSQYWTQGPTAGQYKAWDRYEQTSTDINRPWSQMYAGALSDFDYVQTEALAQGNNNYAACAMIMKAYCFQYMTDVWGDIPFSQALQGANKLTPAYDKQEDVYKGIEKMLLDAKALIDLNSDKHPGTEDVMFGGDMHHWLELANTLRLKVYLRQAYTSEAARCKDSVMAMTTRGDEFLTVDATIGYSGAQGMKNPLNTTISALGDFNLLASATVIDSMSSMNDPRMSVLFKTASTGTAKGQFVGLTQGSGQDYPTTSSTAHTNWSLPGAAVGGGQNQSDGAAANVYLITYAETYFMLAEACARGWATGDGAAEYDEAVAGSFSQWGLAAADVTAYLSDSRAAYPTSGSAADKLKAIITQKWYSFCGSQNIEAWIEHRRTGYPDFFKTSASSNLGAGIFPARFVLPSDELTRNPNAGAAAKLITDKVWWDQN